MFFPGMVTGLQVKVGVVVPVKVKSAGDMEALETTGTGLKANVTVCSSLPRLLFTLK